MHLGVPASRGGGAFGAAKWREIRQIERLVARRSRIAIALEQVDPFLSPEQSGCPYACWSYTNLTHM
jgi:hypothetical protein